MTFDEKLKQLKEVAEKATPGPWSRGCANVGQEIVEDDDICEILAATGPSHKYSDNDQYKKVIADSIFIATWNPQTASALLDLITAYKKVILAIYHPNFEDSNLAKLEQEILEKLK